MPSDSVKSTDEYYMRLALEQAQEAARQGEVPIGAVVVYDPIDKASRKHILPNPRLISRAYNSRERDKNPAGHAEFLAIEAAAQKLGRWRLSGCTVYVTLEPCIMCAGLMHQARIDRCVYGANDIKAGALGSQYSVHEDKRLNHRFKVTRGVLGEECALELSTFFEKRRQAKDKAIRK